MPTIPIYQRQIVPQGASPNVKGDVADPGVVGEGIAALGRAAVGLGDVLLARKVDLDRQKQDSIIIEKKALVDEDIRSFREQYEKNFKGLDATGGQDKINEFYDSLKPKYAMPDDIEANNRLSAHINTRVDSLRDHLSLYEASELKSYSKNARLLALESAKKDAALGDIGLAVASYSKTLKEQLDNKTLSKDEYDLLLQSGQGDLYESHIEALYEKDPVSAWSVLKASSPMLRQDQAERLSSKIKPAMAHKTGMDIGTEIFKRDETTKTLEEMIDEVKKKDLPPNVTTAAIDELKDQYNVRHRVEEEAKKEIKLNTIKTLNDKSLGRGGRSLIRDLTPQEWAKLNESDPEFARSLQDSIQRDADAQLREARLIKNEAEAKKRADRTAAAEERRLLNEERAAKKREQQEFESAILSAPDFLNFNLEESLAKKEISSNQYLKLSKVQKSYDPIKSDAAKQALSRVKVGAGLASALKIDIKEGEGSESELAIWKNKYADLVKAFVYNNYDKPDFEAELSSFVEDRILREMTTDFFKTRETERGEKYSQAKAIAGEIPPKKQRSRIPTEEEFVAAAMKANSAYTIEEIKAEYKARYGGKK